MKKMPSTFAKFAKSVALTLAGSVALLPSAQALSVKADPLAAKGCIPRISKEASLEVMRRFHLHSRNASQVELRTLGTTLAYIQILNSGKALKRATATPDSNYSFSFNSSSTDSHQHEAEIRINRHGHLNYGQNVAQLAHELGHFIGNRGGYAAYQDALGGAHRYCRVSTYSRHNPHEQFAEVFAAFVTRPALLKKNPSTNCQKAYRFFANVIFGKAGPVANRCVNRQAAYGIDDESMDSAQSGELVTAKPSLEHKSKPKAKPTPKPVPKPIVKPVEKPADKPDTSTADGDDHTDDQRDDHGDGNDQDDGNDENDNDQPNTATTPPPPAAPPATVPPTTPGKDVKFTLSDKPNQAPTANANAHPSANDQPGHSPAPPPAKPGDKPAVQPPAPPAAVPPAKPAAKTS